MPTPQNILAHLGLAASSAMPIAIVWHGLTLAAGLALLSGWRPTRRVAGALLAAPIASVSAVAFAYGNPFNGVLLGVLALLLVGLAWPLASDEVRRGGTAATILGLGMIAFGWLYPHFLESRPMTIYLYAAPTGVVPCPSLSLVVGFALLSRGLGSRAWSLALAIAGLFYGLFGVARLGVRLDIVLVGGSAALLALALRKPTHAPRAAALPDWQEQPRYVIGGRP
jgi:hypothetical protein